MTINLQIIIWGFFMSSFNFEMVYTKIYTY
jgi:hypothetical protein